MNISPGGLQPYAFGTYARHPPASVFLYAFICFLLHPCDPYSDKMIRMHCKNKNPFKASLSRPPGNAARRNSGTRAAHPRPAVRRRRRWGRRAGRTRRNRRARGPDSARPAAGAFSPASPAAPSARARATGRRAGSPKPARGGAEPSVRLQAGRTPTPEARA